ncbi:MAG: hypothetical protein HYS27_28035 [Deltaproteobacteria bacterium]|nr:hypothetical protein [Deltaproteobacteria bacterium]
MLLLLVVAIALVHLAVRALFARCGETRGALAWATTLAVLAVLPELLGRPFESIAVGLAATALVCAAPAAWWWHDARPNLAWPQALPHFAAGRNAERVAAAALVLLGTWVALGTFLWDEGTTHFGLAASMARGVLPPEHPLFPGEPFAYHYGYDVLVALLVRATPLPLAWCCDVVTVACLLVLAAALAEAGRALAGAHGAWLAVVAVPLGYGPAAALLADGWGTALPGVSLLPGAWVSAQKLPPPVISSFFQHPQGLGMPVALAALLLAAAPAADERSARVRWLGASALLALLAPVQTVFFLLTGLALGVMVAVLAWRDRRARALWRLLPLAVGAAAGVALAPLLRSAGGDALVAGGYFGDALAPRALRHLLLFGGSLLAAPLALTRLRADAGSLRAGLIAAAVAGFLVANMVSYGRSWDVVKFFAVGSFFGNLLLADLLASAFDRRAPWRALALTALVLSTWSGAFWLLRHGPLNGVVAARYTERGPDAIGVALAGAFGDVMPARARVLTSHTDVHQAGLLVEGADWRRGGEGYRLDRQAQDHARALAERALRSRRRDDLLATGADFLLVRGAPAADAPVTRLGDVAGFTLYRIERGR